MTLRPAVFLDRDGTIIVEREYLSDPAEVELLPGVPEALNRLRDAGLPLVVITNQAGIGRGYYGVADYEAVASRLADLLGALGVSIDGTRFCPHHPDVTGPCTCRKPHPGMFLDAAEALELDPAKSFLVGDKLTDVDPGIELGGTGILVRTGYGRKLESAASEAVIVVDDLSAVTDTILEQIRG